MRLLLTVLTCFTSFYTSFSNLNPNSLNSVLYSGDYEFIDLTYPFDEHTNYWIGTQNFVFTRKNENYRSDGTWYAAKEFATGEHGGTHIDAPYHFNQQGSYVADITLDKLIVPLVVIDISQLVDDHPGFVLYKDHLKYLFNFNMDKPSLVIFKFGWSKYYDDRKKYFGIIEGDNINLNFPGVGKDAMEWLHATYPNIVGIGVDTASADPGFSQEFPVHKYNANNGLYQIENVKLDRPIPSNGCTALVMPMKISQGTGAPTRLVAICPKSVPKVEASTL